jgi:hypothetical protein
MDTASPHRLSLPGLSNLKVHADASIMTDEETSGRASATPSTKTDEGRLRTYGK